MSKYPISNVCPECGSADYTTRLPETWVAFVSDRVCKDCKTRYTPPTPAWAPYVFILSGFLLVILGTGCLLLGFSAPSLVEFPVLEWAILLVFVAILASLGSLVIVHGIGSLLPGLDNWLLTKVLDPLADWLDERTDPILFVIFHRITRYIASWLLALIIALLVLDVAWGAFNSNERRDFGADKGGNNGHCTIDFGGQWVMGAMLVQGNGQELYNRNVQREVLRGALPREHENPAATRSDADELMGWLMGPLKEEPEFDDAEAGKTVGSLLAPLAAGDAPEALTLLAAGQKTWTPDALAKATTRRVGGPLYPPFNALVYAPLGALDPHYAYRVNQLLNVFWAFVAGLGISYLSQRRLWCPLAASLILIYPGFRGSIHLGQNAPLSLAILVWGWALIARDRPVWGGLIWGLFLFKPVWALAFFLVPLLTGRWRVCLAMAGMGTTLALLTLPFVGWHSWWDWLRIGKDAADLYKTDENWIYLSRDLLTIPRRWLIDFSIPRTQRDNWNATWLGWTLLGWVVLITTLFALWRPRQARLPTGPTAAFLLCGAWMSCYHFMYYDILLTALPLLLLFTEPRQYLQPIFMSFFRIPRSWLGGELAGYYGPRLANEYPPPVPLIQLSYRNIWVLNRLPPYLVIMLLIIEHFFQYMGLGMTFGGLWLSQPLQITTEIYHHGQPWDTYCIMFVWLYCGWWWLRLPAQTPEPRGTDVELIPLPVQTEQLFELETDVGRGHERLAD